MLLIGLVQLLWWNFIVDSCCVVIDTLQQIESHLMMRHYDGLLNSGHTRSNAGVAAIRSLSQGMNIFLKTEDEIELMREANLLVGKTLAEVGRHVKPGVTTLQLDKIAEELIRDNGAIPTFKGFPSSYGPPFPGSICSSVNDVVVHGIPVRCCTEGWGI